MKTNGAHLQGGKGGRGAREHLQVLHELPRKSARSKGGVNALRGEVVQLLEVGVHHDLLLVGVLEGLDPRQGAVLPSDDLGTAPQAGQVPPQQIEQHSLGNIVGIVACRVAWGLADASLKRFMRRACSQNDFVCFIAIPA